MRDAEPVDESKEEEWRHFSLDDYRACAAQQVHYSTKTANSNAAAGGIRLSQASGLQQPYLSVRTLLGSGREVALDYMKNAGSTATLAKQIRQAFAQQGSGSPAELAAIRECVQASTAEPLEAGTREIGPRLKQVLLPKAEALGGYVAVTPLSSAGVAAQLDQHVKAINQLVKDYRTENRRPHPKLRRIRIAQLGFGGSNPQNVGGLVRSLQRLVVFEAPREHPRIRQAYALYHQRSQLRLSTKAMREYASWRRDALRANGGRMPSDLAHRTREAQIVSDIAHRCLDQFRAQYDGLRSVIDVLPDVRTPDGEKSMFRLEEAIHIKAIVEPSWRKFDWKREVANEVAHLIVMFAFADGTTLALGDDDRVQIAVWIEEKL